MKLGPNDCHLCGEDVGRGMCGFDTLEGIGGASSVTLLVCMRCKVGRDGRPSEEAQRAVVSDNPYWNFGPRREG